MNNRVIITGMGGQDGTYLRSHLHGLGREVYSISTSSIDSLTPDYSFDCLKRVFNMMRPIEVYHLASPSSPRESIENPEPYKKMNVDVTEDLLKLCREYGSKFFYASSSEAFGATPSRIVQEDSIKNPVTPYGLYKSIGSEIVKYYRSMGVFASTGYMFTHISPIKPIHFVSQKIIKEALEVKTRKREVIKLGYVGARRDWGHAKDYVVAMGRMLALDEPVDLILCTGNVKTVKEYSQIACDVVGIDFSHVIYEDIPSEIDYFTEGNSGLAKNMIGWNPCVDLREIISEIAFPQNPNNL